MIKIKASLSIKKFIKMILQVDKIFSYYQRESCIKLIFSMTIKIKTSAPKRPDSLQYYWCWWRGHSPFKSFFKSTILGDFFCSRVLFKVLESNCLGIKLSCEIFLVYNIDQVTYPLWFRFLICKLRITIVHTSESCCIDCFQLTCGKFSKNVNYQFYQLNYQTKILFIKNFAIKKSYYDSFLLSMF